MQYAHVSCFFFNGYFNNNRQSVQERYTDQMSALNSPEVRQNHKICICLFFFSFFFGSWDSVSWERIKISGLKKYEIQAGTTEIQ